MSSQTKGLHGIAQSLSISHIRMPTLALAQYPRVGSYLLDPVPLFRILLQQVYYQVFCFFGYALPEIAWECHRLVLYLLKQRLQIHIIVCLVGYLPAQEMIHQNSQRPEIHSEAIDFATYDLGRIVIRSSTSRCKDIIPNDPCQSKIG